MRRQALLLALLVSAADAAPAAAQSPLERRITVHIRDVALRDALDRVAAAGAFRLSYSSENLPLDQRVTVWRDTSAVGEVLAEMLRTFPVVPIVMADDQVVLAPRRAQSHDTAAANITVLDRVVVTGSVLGAPARGLPVALDVIAGRDIERRGQTSLASVFDGSVPGVWMWEQAPTAMLARYASIRGASSFGVSFPKVYIDGIEVANPLLLTQVTPELVERVEVIRGPQGAALYGSDAISGVVNVISRHDAAAADGARVLLRSEGGYSAAFASSAVAVQQHVLSATLGSNLRSVGFSLGGATSGAYVPKAYSREVRATAGTRLIGAQSALTASARFFGKNAGVPASPLLAALKRFRSDSQPQALRMYTVGSTLTHTPNEIWTLAATGGVDGYALANATSEWSPIPFFVDSALRDARGSALRATMRASGVARVGNPEHVGATLTFALEHSTLRDRTYRGTPTAGSSGAGAADTSTYVVDWSRNFGFTSQADFAFRNTAFVTAGMRQERIGLPTGGSQLSLLPMLGGALVRDLSGVTVKARAALGKGIRAPNASVRARTAEPRHRLENLLLVPEQQTGVEAGVDLLVGTRVGVHLTRFDQLASGLIQTVTVVDPAGTFSAPRYWHQLQNVGEISNRGWEAQASATQGPFMLSGAVTTVDSRVQKLAKGYTGDLRPGDRMLAVPARTLTGSITWARKALHLTSTVSRASDWTNYDRLAIAQCYVAAQCADKQNMTGATLRRYWTHYDGNTRVRGSVSYDLRSGLSLTFTGENLLNYQRGEPDSITIVPGRTLTAGIRARF